MTDQPFAEAVRDCSRAALAEGIYDEGFRRLVALELSKRPFILSEKGTLRAAPIVIGAFEAAGGSGARGVRAGAAMEFLMAALHLFDRVEDGEKEAKPSDIQAGLTLHYLMGCLLARDVDWSPVYRLMATVCAGQQKDIDMQGQRSPSLEDAKLMTLQKSGAFGEALAVAGGLAADAPQGILVDLAVFGQYFGMGGQLLDDAADASPARPDTSDIRLRKKTLPIAHFLSCDGDDPERDRLRRRFRSPEQLTPEEEQAIRLAVQASGGTEMVVALASWYRMRAAGIIERLQKKGCNTRLLRAHLALEGSAPLADGAAIAL